MDDQELNEAVARKLGWIKDFDFGWLLPLEKQNVKEKGFFVGQAALPAYSTSIAAAWTLAEKYLQAGGEFSLWRSGDLTRYSAHFDLVGAEADTAARAICLAFLKLP